MMTREIDWNEIAPTPATPGADAKAAVQRDTVVTHTALTLGISYQAAKPIVAAAERAGYRWSRI